MNTDAVNAHSRQFKRHGAQFLARFEPHPDHVNQLRLSFPDALCDLIVSDVSRGGLGLIAGIFLPRNLRGTVHVELPPGAEGRSYCVRVIVRRCVMLDHRPNYQIGLQFVDSAGPDEAALAMAVTKGQETEKQLVGAGSGGSRL